MQINPGLTAAANTLEGRSQTLLPGAGMMVMVMVTVTKIPRDSWKIPENKNICDMFLVLLFVSPLPRMLLIFFPSVLTFCFDQSSGNLQNKYN